MILFLAALLAPLPWVVLCQINPVTGPMAGGRIRVSGLSATAATLGPPAPDSGEL